MTFPHRGLVGPRHARGATCDHERVRISYDPDADAAYIYLTDEPLMPGRDCVPCDTPDGVSAMVILDWRDGRLTGLEVLDASAVLHRDLLVEAARPGQ